MILGLVAIALLAGPALPASAAAAGESADLATTLHSPTTTITTGYVSYAITVTNHGPNYARTVILTDKWWSGITSFYHVSGSAPSGVTCTAPTVGSYGPVTCTTPSLAPGASLAITLTIYVRILFHNQLLIDTATASSQTFDPNTANNTATWIIEG